MTINDNHQVRMTGERREQEVVAALGEINRFWKIWLIL